MLSVDSTHYHIVETMNTAKHPSVDQELSFPTESCTDKCKGYCGYCRVHEKAVFDENGDAVVGKRGQVQLFISTVFSKYPCIERMTNDSGLIFGRGTTSVSIVYGVVGGPHASAQQIVCSKGQSLFGIKLGPHVVGVGGRIWKH